MSLSNKKFLISGCGISWSGQERPTWVKILRSIGINITDVGDPAVSNQYILNQTILELVARPIYSTVFVQLTAMGKLDVQISSDEQKAELVNKDSLRNFTINNIWPSSFSTEHESKKLWSKWLYSPDLEQQDVAVKLLLLNDFCSSRNIVLKVIQGYDIDWIPKYISMLNGIVDKSQQSCYAQYMRSMHWQQHDHSDKNLVPNLGYQLMLAESFVKTYAQEYLDQLDKISKLIR